MIRAWQLANVLRCGKTTVILSPAVGYKNVLITINTLKLSKC